MPFKFTSNQPLLLQQLTVIVQRKDWLYKNVFDIITGWSKRRHKVNDTIILQLYVIESCGFQQNVRKQFFA